MDVEEEATPTHGAPSFRCPTCEKVSQQHWFPMKRRDFNGVDSRVLRSDCQLCGSPAYWIDEELVVPPPRIGTPASPDLEGQQLEIYNEARAIAARSPRAAVALLRLLVELLVNELHDKLPEDKQAKRDTLNERIKSLSNSGDLNRRVIDAMHAVRLVGNEAVHAGLIELEIDDAPQVIDLLFRIVNMIIDNTRTLPRQVGAVLEQHDYEPKTPKADAGS
jgi:hypothetical protein